MQTNFMNFPANNIDLMTFVTSFLHHETAKRDVGVNTKF